MNKGHLRVVPSPLTPELGLEPGAERFLRELKNQTPMDSLSPDEARKALERIQGPRPSGENLEIEDILVPFAPDQSVSVQIMKPKSSDRIWPVLMYLHGGGWISGTDSSYHRLLRDLCLGSQSAVAFVRFSLSPEVRYPTALEQSYAVAEYLASHGGRLQLDGRHMAIAGDSVGANMATVLCRWSHERRGPRFLCQILFYPVTDAALETESVHQFSQGPWLSEKMMRQYWSAYEPEEEKRLRPDLSPLRTSIESLKGLPAALIITGENDLLRDEGEAYAHRLVEAGVNVTAIRVLGTIPDFVMLNALAHTEATRNVLDLTCARLRSVFSSNPGLLLLE